MPERRGEPAGRRASPGGTPRTRSAAPLHPIFVHFTIALTASSLAFDAGAKVLEVPSLAEAGWWTLALAVAATVGTLVTGVTSRLRLAMEEGAARRFLRAHMALGPAFFGLQLAVAVWRAALWEDGRAAPWGYLAALGGVVLVMGVQGYLGGELVYRFGAEVRGRYRRLPSEARPRTGRPGGARARTV